MCVAKTFLSTRALLSEAACSEARGSRARGTREQCAQGRRSRRRSRDEAGAGRRYSRSKSGIVRPVKATSPSSLQWSISPKPGPQSSSRGVLRWSAGDPGARDAKPGAAVQRHQLAPWPGGAWELPRCGFSAAYAWALPSGERCLAWNGDPRNRRCAIPIVTVRAEVLTGVQGHFPGDLLAGVGGHAAHDRQQHAPGHVLRRHRGNGRAARG